ncbi:MAG: hypothetical protein LBH98_08240 [Chitinispirillales bacterium]|jgi:hypothetical protein|nr:hypothetical protein [Chitinispirillales bacterium]
MFKTLDEVVALPEIMYNAVSYAVETITFLSVNDEISSNIIIPKNTTEYITGSILIKTAPAIYSMELLVPQDLLEKISADITVPGTESEMTGSIVIDIAMELLNTIAGNLMRNIEMLVGPFILEIPEFEIGKSINKRSFIVKKYIADDNYSLTIAITKI